MPSRVCVWSEVWGRPALFANLPLDNIYKGQRMEVFGVWVCTLNVAGPDQGCPRHIWGLPCDSLCEMTGKANISFTNKAGKMPSWLRSPCGIMCSLASVWEAIIGIGSRSANSSNCSRSSYSEGENPLFCGHSIRLVIPRVIGGGCIYEHRSGEFRSVCGKIIAPCFVFHEPPSG